MKNYHYYLKQELVPHTTDRRFVSIRWHPEQPNRLYLIGESELV